MRVRVDGVRLFFDVEGVQLLPDGPWLRERPTVVALHPGPGIDHAGYKTPTFGSRLAEVAQVVYVDLRGHGRSDRGPEEELTLDRWADDVKGFCDALEIERPIVFGNGFGAIVAATYGARYPEHPARLALLNPAARIVPERSVAVFERLGAPAAAEAAARFYAQPDQHTFAEFIRHCFPYLTTMDTSAEVMARASWTPDLLVRWRREAPGTVDLRPVLGAIRAPCLVLAGEDDAETTREAADEFVAALPPELVRYRVFPGARHSLASDAPGAVEELWAFVLGEPPPG